MTAINRYFRPVGRAYGGVVGSATRPNPGVQPFNWEGPDTYEAILLIGLAARGDVSLDVFTIVAMVHDLLVDRTSNASSSFIAQHGIWQEKLEAPSVFEKSVSVKLIAGKQVDVHKWAAIIQEVAQDIATIARQDLVIVQFTLNGTVRGTIEITSGDATGEMRSLAHFRARGREVRAAILGR